MGPGQVHHMDIVPDGRTIRGVVVIAIDIQALPDSGCCLGDEGDQVVGYPNGKLTDQGRFVGAYGIEVSQGNHPYTLCAGHCVLQDLFTDLLGVSIGRVGLLDGSLFCHRKYIGFAINRAGGRENHVIHCKVLHGLQKMDQRQNIILIILQRLLHAFPHCLECGKMDDGIHVAVFLKDPESAFPVSQVHLFKYRVLPCNGTYAL